MTGFGSASMKLKGLDIEVRIRCLNSRFFEGRFNLPPEYYPFENEIRKYVQARVRRANMDFYIRKTENCESSNFQIKSNLKLAKAWAKEYKRIADDMGLGMDLDTKNLCKVPAILQIEELKSAKIWEKDLVFKCLDKALGNLEKQRQREGLAQKRELSLLLNKITKELNGIKKLRNQANKELAQRYKKRIVKFKEAKNFEPQRLAQEIVIQIDKSDINEEIIRLNEHIRSFKALLNTATGKKLDFYIQEILREFNTIGSKSQIAPITRAVVEAKTNIERMREIVQNIE